ncbi:MAG TPA: MlaD family protein [Candidatus Baltobacteraceae bacterium]|nr:MlaD family protein [Candidatus Baltobacteraceae bacterium]
MARTRAVRVTRPARLGLIALVAILIAAGIFVALKYMRGAGGYQIGVHFPQAAGVAPGAQVFLNGVAIGGVTKVKILPDTTVDFIINVLRDTPIPKSATFTVQSTVTGTRNVAISVPPQPVSPADVWPKRVLPVREQPSGTPPLTLETFMAQSKSLGDRAYRVLALARPYGKPLLRHLQNARANGAATTQELRATLPSVMGDLRSTVARARANVQDAQTALRERDRGKLEQIAASFQRSAADMKRTSAALDSLKRDPSMRANVRAASAQLRAVTGNMAELSRDLQMITGNPQTKAQLRDAGARLRALLQKL